MKIALGLIALAIVSWFGVTQVVPIVTDVVGSIASTGDAGNDALIDLAPFAVLLAFIGTAAVVVFLLLRRSGANS
jgi:multisubunit Na+/H+ antiporter MnhF subunit